MGVADLNHVPLTQNEIGPYQPNANRTLDLAENAQERPSTVVAWQPFCPKADLNFLGLRRLKVLAQSARTFPPWCEVEFGQSVSQRWAVYFCYAPDGKATAAHRFTIERLRDDGFAILAVCAAPDVADTREFRDLGLDGLIWKGLRGYDFSGYTLGLEALARRFDAVDVLVMNDSVLGPLHSIRPMTDSTPWDLTGFMTAYAVEHHIQSFAFLLKGYGQSTADHYRKVFLRRISFNTQGPVSFLQETRLGSALPPHVRIGSVVAPSSSVGNAYCLLGNPAGLLDIGFPYLKRSIFGKFADGFDQGFYRERLEQLGHPTEV